jgi:hypothetical protein
MGLFSSIASFAAPVLGNIAGGLISSSSNKSINNQNIQQQREFAQDGIQWKVADAKAAGIHPLYALGANTTSFTPQNVGGSSYDLGRALADSGQDIGRAIRATSTKAQRQLQDINLQSAKLDLEGKEIDNAIRASQLAKMSQQIGPSLPTANDNLVISGQGDSPVDVNRQQVTAVSRSNPSQFSGGHASTTFLRSDTGGLIPVMSNAQGEPREDMDVTDLNALDWFARNRILPVIKGITPPSTRDFPLPKGGRWKWDAFRQEFRPWYGKKWKLPFLK